MEISFVENTLTDKREEIREYWRNASKRYYEKHRDIVKAKKLAYYYKKMGIVAEPKLEVEIKNK